MLGRLSWMRIPFDVEKRGHRLCNRSGRGDRIFAEQRGPIPLSLRLKIAETRA